MTDTGPRNMPVHTTSASGSGPGVGEPASHQRESHQPASSPAVYVISGPTAVGKGTVVKALCQLHPEVFVSCSATTRQPRPGEVNGIAYYFIDDVHFDELIATDGLLEWADVHGSRYGTPKEPVTRAVEQGKTVILEIDLQGARQVRHTYPGAVQIFLAPPSWDELVHRLQGRGTETSAQQERRLETARRELAAESEFDHIVVNQDVEATVNKMVELMKL